MSRLQFVEKTVEELGADLGMPGLSLDSSGRASYSVDGIRLTLSYTDEPMELLWLLVDVSELSDHDPRLLRGLLAMGYLAWTGDLMTLAVDEAGSRVFGHNCMPVSALNARDLRVRLDGMREAAGAIRDRISTGNFELSTL